MTNGFIWSNIEPNCSVIAACLPTYGPIFAGRRQKGGISFFSSLRARILSLSGGSSKGGSKGSKGGSKNSSGLDARGHLSDRLSSDGSETLITSSDLSMNNHHHSNSNSKNLGRHVTMIKSVNSLSHDDDDNTYELQHGHEMPARTHHDGWQKISDVPFSGGDNSVHITSVSGQQQQQESFEGGDLESQHPAPMRIEVTKVFGNQYQRA
ncbi:hypothetical protein MMC27_007575 [Xylographa pallens]|nr:hypothetical protein [Xylographa pallens]